MCLCSSHLQSCRVEVLLSNSIIWSSLRKRCRPVASFNCQGSLMLMFLSSVLGSDSCQLWWQFLWWQRMFQKVCRKFSSKLSGYTSHWLILNHCHLCVELLQTDSCLRGVTMATVRWGLGLQTRGCPRCWSPLTSRARKWQKWRVARITPWPSLTMER